jgi:hypothetical protein
VVVRASQEGDSDYLPAPSVDQAFFVTGGSAKLFEPRFLTGGLFKFRLEGVPNVNYRIEASTNFEKWIQIFTTNSLSGTVECVDPDSALDPQRFYRAVVP